MKVRVIKKCYFGERVRKPGAILELQESDMNKGNKLPSWAEAVDSNAEEKEPDGQKAPEPTTLHEIADKPKAKVSKPAKKK